MIKVLLILVVLFIAWPFLIMLLGFFIAQTSMNSELVKLYGELPDLDRRIILMKLYKRKALAFLITAIIVFPLEYYWLQFLHSISPF